MLKASFFISIQMFILFLGIGMAKASIFSFPTDSIGLERKDKQLYILHLVEPGETLTLIGKKYGMSVKTLKYANPHLGDGLKIKQLIRVPFQLPGENTSTLLQQRMYIVKRGDSLYEIARKFNMDYTRLTQLNNIKDKGKIYPKQKLVVEVKEESLENEENNSGLPAWLFQPALNADEIYTKSEIRYTVQPKETVNSISQKFDAPIDSLRSWNKLLNDAIYADKEIIIGYRYLNANNEVVVSTLDEHALHTAHVKSKEPSKLTNPKVVTDATTVGDVKNPDPKVDIGNNNKTIVKPIPANLPQNKQHEGNAALMLNEKELNPKRLFAYHQSARKGTFVMIRNKNNGEETWVKIIGATSAADQKQGVVIRINKLAAQRLGLPEDLSPEQAFRVELEYNE